MLALWGKKSGSVSTKTSAIQYRCWSHFRYRCVAAYNSLCHSIRCKAGTGYIYSNSSGIYCSIFRVSRLQALPTSAFIVVLSAITSKYGIEGLQIASLIAGVILLFLDLVKIGSIIKFIPAPVIIWVGQWKFFLNYLRSQVSTFIQRCFI
jgi:hypothetical protein